MSENQNLLIVVGCILAAGFLEWVWGLPNGL